MGLVGIVEETVGEQVNDYPAETETPPEGGVLN